MPLTIEGFVENDIAVCKSCGGSGYLVQTQIRAADQSVLVVPGPNGQARPVDLVALDPSHGADDCSSVFRCASCGSLLVLSLRQDDLYALVYQRVAPAEMN